ncbi:MAG: thioredoxin family protein [Eubacteriales bacterium]|nr:thioredoxin family protein [Eubacteriales bacterium]
MERNKEKSFVEETNICFCAGAFPRETRPAGEERVLILGTDGWKRRWLARSVSKALADLGESEPICFRADPADQERYYVLGTPALVIDGTVVSVGCVLSRHQARIYLERYLS